MRSPRQDQCLASRGVACACRPEQQQHHRASMLTGSRLALGCLVWSLCLLLSDAYLFSLLLSNPVVRSEPAADASDRGNSVGASVSERGMGNSVSALRASSDNVRPMPLRTRSAARAAAAQSHSDLDLSLDVALDLGLGLDLSPERGESSGETREEDLRDRRRGQSASAMRHGDSEDAEERGTEDGDSSRQNTLVPIAGSVPEEEAGCLSDQECGRGRYCDTAEGECRRRRRPGQQCERDGECRGRGSTCNKGHCQRRQRQHKPKPEPVSECRSDADCDPDSCCARLSTGTECRPRTPVGHRCQALPANLPVPIYATCPCERGTECKYVHRPGEDWTLWTAYDNLRCVRE